MAETYSNVEVTISHADSDDCFDLENASIYDAQRAACDRIIATWAEHENENAGMGGYPVYGVVVEAYDLDDAGYDYCYAEAGDFREEYDGFCSADWKAEDGSAYPQEGE